MLLLDDNVNEIMIVYTVLYVFQFMWGVMHRDDPFWFGFTFGRDDGDD